MVYNTQVLSLWILLKKGSGSCSTHYLNSRKFERLVIDKIKERILTENNLRKLITMVNEEMEAASTENWND